MESISQRLKFFLQYKELNTTAFCRRMRYKSCEKIARLFRSGNAKPSADILADIARHFPELDVRWLITGEGDMLAPPVVPSFILQDNGGEMVRASPVMLAHGEWEMEKVSKPVPGALINFIGNMRDEN